MFIRKLAAAAVVFAAPLVAASGAGAATFFPTTVQATCISACLDEHSKTYSQTYAASSFSGPVTISAFAFDKALLGDNQTAVFHVTFWTADGTEVGDFGHYMVGSLAGDKLVLKGDSFTFDPRLGNLTMRIQLDDAERNAGGGGGGGGFFGGGGGFNGGGFNGGGGLSGPGPGSTGSGFNVTPPALAVATGGGAAVIAAVPEPSAWALMVLGFGGAGALLRARRRPRTA